MSASESDFVDDIIGKAVPAHISPAPLHDIFSPWHRVRKEFIRQQQWNELTIRMLQRRWSTHISVKKRDFLNDDDAFGAVQSEPTTNSNDRDLRCLVIPGQDLLDLRALWRDLRQFGCSIRYLGFNEGHGSREKGTRVFIANNAVTSLENVATDSCVIHDRFESIANDKSQALRYLKQYGPYHIVNLDLCGTMCPSTNCTTQAYYDALMRLFGYQSEHQKGEWLLLVTTMIEPAIIDQPDFLKLCTDAKKNFDSNPSFARETEKLVPRKAFPKGSATVDLTGLDEEELIKLFGLALAKWILAICQSARPKSTVAMRRSYRYTANKDKGAVMLSLAFEIKPNVSPPVDTAGVSKLALKAKKYPDEAECAVKIATSVGGIKDVDQLLAADKALWIRLRDAQAGLLASAGYDPEKYVKWTDDGESVS